MSIMAEQMGDQPLHMEDLMNLNVDPDAAMVDPQLAMPYFASLAGKPNDQMTIDPTMWQNPFDSFTNVAEPFESFMQSQNKSTDNADQEMVESATSASSPSTTTRPLIDGKTSRTSSKSSVPSLSSGVSSPGKRTRSKTTTKKEEPKKKEAKTSRTKQKPKKEIVVEEIEDDNEDQNDDSKRNKYLERNRIAASKCRQKKKMWVSDLETQKGELEAMHSKLQHEYSTLVDQVTQLKNDLMVHAGCGDPNIDSWIETEAKRFVQRTTDRSDQNQRRVSSSGSAARRLSHSAVDSMMQPSPAASAEAFPGSPMIKQEEMNYDHMPDDMFT